MVGAWIARYLGPKQYGDFFYIITFIGFFQIVVTLGLDTIVVREISLNNTNAAKILGTTFYLRFMVSIIAWSIASISMGIIEGWGSEEFVFVIIAGIGLLFQAADTVDLWFQSQNKNRYTVFAKFAMYLISNFIKIIFILLQLPLFYFIIALALDAIILAGCLYFLYKSYPCNDIWTITYKSSLSLLRESWPLLLSGIFVIIYMRIDQIIIKSLLGEKALGIYAVVLSLSVVWSAIPVAVGIALGPNITALKIRDEILYKNTLIIVFRCFFYSALGISLVTLLCSNLIIGALYGEEYSDAVLILKVHIFSNVFSFLGVAHSLWLVNQKILSVRLIGTFIAGITSIVLNYFLIKAVGLLGAAITAVITQCLASLLINYWFERDGFLLQLRAIFFINRN